MMNKVELTYQDILLINRLCLLEDEPFGVMDENRIQSALGNQYQPYPNMEQAFASLYKSLVINHGFMNGNKRVGVIALYIASRLLNKQIKLNDEELCALTYKIAGEGGSHISVEDIANQVFGEFFTNQKVDGELNLQELVNEYIKYHEWLIKELAK